MLDILILDDDWEGATAFKEAICTINGSLRVNATISRSHALQIMAKEPIKLIIMEPDFYGYNMERGKDYIKLIKEILPQQAIAINTATVLSDNDIISFKKQGISIFMKKPLMDGGLKQYCDVLINEVNNISDAACSNDCHSVRISIKEDYGKLTRINALFKKSLHFINHLYADTIHMKHTYDKARENDSIRLMAIDLLKRIEEGTDFYEEMVFILYKEHLLSKEKLYAFETPYRYALRTAYVQIERLVNERFDDRIFQSIYGYALQEYDSLSKALNVLVDNVRNKV